MSVDSDRKGAGGGLWEQAPGPESDEATPPTGGRGGRAEVAPGDDTACGGAGEPAGAGGALVAGWPVAERDRAPAGGEPAGRGGLVPALRRGGGEGIGRPAALGAAAAPGRGRAGEAGRAAGGERPARDGRAGRLDDREAGRAAGGGGLVGEPADGAALGAAAARALA